MNDVSFDELNKLSEESMRSEPYEKYFEDMEITDEQKEERIKFSKDIEPVLLYILALASMMIKQDSIDRLFLIKEFKTEYLDIVEKYMAIDDYILSYSDILSNNIINATFDNSDEYFLSHDRVYFISECEANSILNYSDFKKAVLEGKKYKTWVDIRDRRERKTHREVGGKTIPILESFAVGSSLLLYPKDTSLGASSSEIVNCRCTVKYS